MANIINYHGNCEYLIYIESAGIAAADSIKFFRTEAAAAFASNFDKDYIAAVKLAVHCVSCYLSENFFITHTPDFHSFAFENDFKDYMISGKSAGFAAAISYFSYIAGLNVPDNIAVSGALNEDSEAENIAYVEEKIEFVMNERPDITQIIIPAASLQTLTNYNSAYENFIPGVCKIIGIKNIAELLEIVFSKEKILSKIFMISGKNDYFIEQRHIITEYNKMFCGRENIINEIYNCINLETSGLLAVSGAAGSGKSALAAKLIQASNLPHHFFGDINGRNNIEPSLKSVIQQLYTKYNIRQFFQDEKITKNIFESFNETLVKLGHILQTVNLKEIIVFDGLDEYNIEANNQFKKFIAVISNLPPNIFVIFFTRRCSNFELLKQQINFEIKEFALDKLSIDNVKQIFESYNFNLPLEKLAEIYNITEGNALYVKSLLKNLKNGFELEKLPVDIETFYKNLLLKICGNKNCLAAEILGVLLVAHTALNESILADILKIKQPEINKFNDTLKKLAGFIEYDETGALKLYHQKFVEYLKSQFFDAVDLIKFNKYFIDYLEPHKTKKIIYGYNYLARHYYDAGLFKDFCALIESEFLENALKTGNSEILLDTLHTAMFSAFDNKLVAEFCRISAVYNQTAVNISDTVNFTDYNMFIEGGAETFEYIKNAFAGSAVLFLFAEFLIIQNRCADALNLLDDYTESHLLFVSNIPQLFYQKDKSIYKKFIDNLFEKNKYEVIMQRSVDLLKFDEHYFDYLMRIGIADNAFDNDIMKKFIALLELINNSKDGNINQRQFLNIARKINFNDLIEFKILITIIQQAQSAGYNLNIPDRFLKKMFNELFVMPQSDEWLMLFSFLYSITIENLKYSKNILKTINAYLDKIENIKIREIYCQIQDILNPLIAVDFNADNSAIFYYIQQILLVEDNEVSPIFSDGYTDSYFWKMQIVNTLISKLNELTRADLHLIFDIINNIKPEKTVYFYMLLKQRFNRKILEFQKSDCQELFNASDIYFIKLDLYIEYYRRFNEFLNIEIEPNIDTSSFRAYLFYIAQRYCPRARKNEVSNSLNFTRTDTEINTVFFASELFENCNGFVKYSIFNDLYFSNIKNIAAADFSFIDNLRGIDDFRITGLNCFSAKYSALLNIELKNKNALINKLLENIKSSDNFYISYFYCSILDIVTDFEDNKLLKLKESFARYDKEKIIGLFNDAHSIILFKILFAVKPADFDDALDTINKLATFETKFQFLTFLIFQLFYIDRPKAAQIFETQISDIYQLKKTDLELYEKLICKFAGAIAAFNNDYYKKYIRKIALKFEYDSINNIITYFHFALKYKTIPENIVYDELNYLIKKADADNEKLIILNCKMLYLFYLLKPDFLNRIIDSQMTLIKNCDIAYYSLFIDQWFIAALIYSDNKIHKQKFMRWFFEIADAQENSESTEILWICLNCAGYAQYFDGWFNTRILNYIIDNLQLFSFDTEDVNDILKSYHFGASDTHFYLNLLNLIEHLNIPYSDKIFKTLFEYSSADKQYLILTLGSYLRRYLQTN
ncbi:MAG TPA: hypothetical protein PKY81_07310 [bacterium]|nr:hypothetical protein [bacterium]